MDDHSNYEPWMDAFITQEKDTGVYTCWDETQCDQVGRVMTKEEAYKRLKDYANWLVLIDLKENKQHERI